MYTVASSLSFLSQTFRSKPSLLLRRSHLVSTSHRVRSIHRIFLLSFPTFFSRYLFFSLPHSLCLSLSPSLPFFAFHSTFLFYPPSLPHHSEHFLFRLVFIRHSHSCSFCLTEYAPFLLITPGSTSERCTYCSPSLFCSNLFFYHCKFFPVSNLPFIFTAKLSSSPSSEWGKESKYIEICTRFAFRLNTRRMLNYFERILGEYRHDEHSDSSPGARTLCLQRQRSINRSFKPPRSPTRQTLVAKISITSKVTVRATWLVKLVNMDSPLVIFCPMMDFTYFCAWGSFSDWWKCSNIFRPVFF